MILVKLLIGLALLISVAFGLGAIVIAGMSAYYYWRTS